MAMGMKMGNNETIKNNEHSQDKNQEKKDNKLNIDEKTAEKEANKVETDSQAKEQIQHLKFIFQNIDKVPEKQRQELKGIIETMKDQLQNTEFFSETALNKIANKKEFPDILDTKVRGKLADKIVKNFDRETFKTLKKVITYPDVFEDKLFQEERRNTLKDFQNTIENIWKKLQDSQNKANLQSEH